MSVSFIVGKPGGGKSMLACRVIIKELITTDRYIITNVPIRVKRIIEYVLARFGCHVLPSRLRVLNDEETKKFFLFRAGDHMAAMPPDGTNGVVDYTTCKGPDGVDRDNGELLPVMYVIDEAHLHFGARDWAKTGKAAMWYLSQHRHFGDNVVFVTQSWKNVDSAFRRLAQEFTTCVNVSKRKAFGFRLPPVFMLRTFDQEPTPYATEVSSEVQRLDVDGLASCYDTAVGVGITSGLADTRDKPTGVHWGWGIAAAVAILVCVAFIPVAMGKGTEMFLRGTQGKQTNGVPVVPHVTNSLPATNAVPVPRLQPQFSPANYVQRTDSGNLLLAQTNGSRAVVGRPIVEEKLAKVRYYLRKEGFVILGLDNGSEFVVNDGRLKVVGNIAIIDGRQVFKLPE